MALGEITDVIDMYRYSSPSQENMKVGAGHGNKSQKHKPRWTLGG